MKNTVSARGRDLITLREGRRLEAYRDSRGVWTIGVGHTGRMAPPAVTAGMTITTEQCDAFLAADLAPVEKALNGALTVSVTQNQFDALASFLFNVGIGWAGVDKHPQASIFAHLNAGDFEAAADAFDLFHKPPEIAGRRNAEKAQFLRPDAPAPAMTLPPIAPQPAPAGLDPSPIAPTGSSPAPNSVPHPATTESTPMNPITGMLTTASAFSSILSTAAPMAIHAAGNVIHNLDDIKAQSKTVVSSLTNLENDFKHLDLNSAAADIGAAWKAGMKIFEDVGISRDTMESVVKTQQNAPAPSTIGKVVDFGESLISQLTQIGLKVAPAVAAAA